jgi:PEP-CTERM motif
MVFNGFTGDIGSSLLVTPEGHGGQPSAPTSSHCDSHSTTWPIFTCRAIRSPKFFTLFLDGPDEILISPFAYGLNGGDHIEWAFIGVIDQTGFTSADLSHTEQSLTRHFRTDLVIAADASQVIPEPGTWAMMLAGAGLAAFGRRRPS